MRVAAFLVRASVRRRWVALVGIGLVLTIGLGVTLAALVAAHRTDHAYGEYVRDAEVADLLVNPAIPTQAVDRAMRSLPEVASVTSDSLLVGSLVDTKPSRFGDLGTREAMLQVRGSPDGRFLDSDRPVVTEGRFASGTREVFINEGEREALEQALDRRIDVGDRLPMAFWPGRLTLQTEGAPEPDAVVRPIAVVTVRVAGFGRSPDEVLPDELYPRQRIIVSRDLARTYGCLGAMRADMSVAEAIDALFPAGCAQSHRLYSVHLRPGASADDLNRSFGREVRRLVDDIPPDLAAQGVSIEYFVDDRADLDRAVQQGTRPIVVSLRVFGILAGAATLAVVALAAWRISRRDEDLQRALRALGASRAQRAVALMSSFAVVLIPAVALAVAVGFVGSGIGPVGTVRSVTPSSSGSLPADVLVPVLLVAVLLLALLVAALTRSAIRRTGRAPANRSPGAWGRRLRWSNRPALTEGVRAALDPRRADGGVIVAGATLVVAAIVAAAVFGANLDRLVNDPDRYGWPWDTAVLSNGGYGGVDPAKVAEALGDDPDVAGWTIHALDPAVSLDERPVPTVFTFTGASASGGRPSSPYRITDGRAPTQAGEALLGAATARDLGVEVGDRVPIETRLAEVRRVRVVGIGVLPSIGLFLSKRAGLGEGAAVVIDADPGDPDLFFPAGLTAVDLRSGVDADAFARRIATAPTWDAYGSPPYASVTSSRPPGIVDADRMRAGPLSLAVILGAGLALGLGLSIGVSVRDRRRELAVLQAVGFTSGNLRATVLWQALATAVAGLVVGLPLGIVAGRLSWRGFANHLDVGPSAAIPAVGITAVALGAVVLALAAALAPAASAGRTRAARALHEVT